MLLQSGHGAPHIIGAGFDVLRRGCSQVRMPQNALDHLLRHTPIGRGLLRDRVVQRANHATQGMRARHAYTSDLLARGPVLMRYKLRTDSAPEGLRD